MRKIGINLHAVEGLTDEEYIKEMAAVGFSAMFSGVLEDDRQAEVGELCARYGVAYETIHAPFNTINNMWRDGEAGEATYGDLTHTIDNCALAGVPITIVHLSSGMNPPSITDIGRDRFDRLVNYAEAKNVKIAFENQRMLANIAWAFETFRQDTVGFCWDCGHEFCFTPGRHYMPLFGGRLICTHIHDNNVVFDEDCHFLPFDGKADFGYVADTLRVSGFKGSLMLEIGNRVRYGSMDPREFLKKAADAAGKLRAMVDRT